MRERQQLHNFVRCGRNVIKIKNLFVPLKLKKKLARQQAVVFFKTSKVLLLGDESGSKERKNEGVSEN